MVRQILVRGQIANPQRMFVLAAVAHGVHEIPALAVHGRELHARRAIGAERHRIDHHVVVDGRVDGGTFG